MTVITPEIAAIIEQAYREGYRSGFYKGLSDDHGQEDDSWTDSEAKDICPPNEWIPWHGGPECPVAPGVKFEVKYRDGSVFNNFKGNYFRWEHTEWSPFRAEWTRPKNDIVFYRVIG